MNIKLVFIPILLVITISVIAQLGENSISIIITSDGKAKVTQTLFPKTYVSTIDVDLISEKISNLLATDEEKIFLGTTQNSHMIKIATLGASQVAIADARLILAHLAQLT